LIHCLDKSAANSAGAKTAQADEAMLGPDESAIRCRSCQQVVTSRYLALAVNGQHNHTMPNPLGIVFEISCFSEAPGCLGQGAVIVEHSWFPPHGWQIGLCRCCRAHLGWYYQAQGLAAFWGLIRAHLLED